MRVLLAYSSKTKNTRKVAKSIYQKIVSSVSVDLVDIKKVKGRLPEYDFYILGCWVDKATVNKSMMKFIEQQGIVEKDVALFMTCGVPSNHYHAHDSINNFVTYMTDRKNKIFGKFICQGKIDPKILIVFKFLSWKDPNFIHKIDDTMLEWVQSSKNHPNNQDLLEAEIWIDNILKSFL